MELSVCALMLGGGAVNPRTKVDHWMVIKVPFVLPVISDALAANYGFGVSFVAIES